MSRAHLLVRLGDERYALPVEAVREVAPVGELTRVPGAPDAVLGVRNLRGQVVPILEVASLLGVGLGGAPRWAVIVEGGAERAGVAVDEALDVRTLGDRREPAPGPLLAGAVLSDGHLVGLVDVPALLAAVRAEAVR